MRVLLFGGSGFIGGALSGYLATCGHSVGIYAKTAPVDAIPFVFHQGDLLNDWDLSDVVGQYDAVIYLVSTTVPESSMRFPERVYTQDIPMVQHALRACREASVRRFVFASSGGTVYGDMNRAAREEDPTWPISHYGIGKVACEQVILMANKLYGMEGISLRIANPYGFGQLSSSPVGAVSMFTRKALAGETITLFGGGEIIRDYLDVSYVSQAFAAALAWPFDQSVLPVFNIGSGCGLTLSCILDKVEKVTGCTPLVEQAPARPFDVGRIFLDVSKARAYLEYRAPADPVGELENYIRQVKALYDQGVFL